MIDEKTERKETASSEHHHWVRLTKACNNKCIFCLDTDTRDESVIPKKTLMESFLLGRTDGATRLILSGGEATLHPDFIELVEYASTLGYRRIQVVSNGRMFAYKDFLDRAIGAGLQEITFSMHGHTPELHDSQTRIPGSFVQALTGITNALESRRLIVNIDIVINKFNYRSIDKIMDFFIGLGIHEFDLLHVTPFGDAWKNRKKVFYTPAEGIKHLNRAFEYSRRTDLFVWTNRFPAAYLTAYPELIQNPLKIKDEVRGRLNRFNDFISGQSPMHCRGARCRYCFMKGLCDDLFQTKKALDSGSVKNLSVKASDLEKATLFLTPELKKLAICGSSVSDLKSMSKHIPSSASLFLFFNDYSGIHDLTKYLPHRDIQAFATNVENLETVFSAEAVLPFFELNAETSEFIAVEKNSLEKYGVTLYYRNRNTLAESLEKDTDMKRFFAAGRFNKLKSINMPACLHHGDTKRLPRFIDFCAIGPRGNIDMQRLSDDYILNGYYVHPAECGGCSKKKSCCGIHVNYFRAFGFKAKPVH